MSRKQRSDSTAVISRVQAAAGKPIDPPSNVPLGERDLPFFASVIDEFARSEWTAHQLELAAMLARTMADLEEGQRLMREEGPTVLTERGTPVVNPRKQLIQMHSGTILSFRRSLQLHARAKETQPAQAGKRTAMLKAAEAEALASDDDLLASPN